jgi:hypothetical protein
MNNKDLEAGIKLGTTSIGTAIGGPIGGAIGSAVGDIASWIIPDKTLIQRKTSYNQSVDPSMSYSRTDTGKGFSNYTVKEREKASTFGNIMNVASDVIPMAASATGFKGIGLDGIGKMFGGGVEEVAKAPFQIPNVSKLPTMEKIATPFTDKVIGANKDIPMLKTAISSTGNMLSEGVGTINSLFDKFNNTSFDDMIG